MGRYNSENTIVLETYMQAGNNKRMLLMHTMDNGDHEYIIGSYFHESRYDGALGYERWDYEWYWGHYFSNVIAAAKYWDGVLKDEL